MTFVLESSSGEQSSAGLHTIWSSVRFLISDVVVSYTSFWREQGLWQTFLQVVSLMILFNNPFNSCHFAEFTHISYELCCFWGGGGSSG